MAKRVSQKIVEESQEAPEYDAQGVIEQALKHGQKFLVPRKYEKYFPYLSEWQVDGRTYRVVHILGAGKEYVQIGVMPKNA